MCITSALRVSMIRGADLGIRVPRQLVPTSFKPDGSPKLLACYAAYSKPTCSSSCTYGMGPWLDWPMAPMPYNNYGIRLPHEHPCTPPRHAGGNHQSPLGMPLMGMPRNASWDQTATGSHPCRTFTQTGAQCDRPARLPPCPDPSRSRSCLNGIPH